MSLDLDGLARLAWVQIWQVTVVALLIGAVVRFFCRYRPRLAYALWMLVVVKSIVPPVWSSPTSLFSWAMAGSAAARPDVARDPDGVGVLAGSPANTPSSEGSARVTSDLEGGTIRNPEMDWNRLRLAVFFVWSPGLVLCAGFVLGKQIVCANLIRRSRLPVDERYISALVDLSRRLGVKREVRLLVTSRPIGPAAFGLLRPSILLPGPLLSSTPLEQVELILAHELIHVRRGDVFASQLQLAAQLIWWFNPLVWWANQQAGRERERCCDQEVVSGVGCKPVLYARTLLGILERKGRMWSLVAQPGVRALEVTSLRLESIMKYPETDHRRASRIARLVFTVGLVLLVPGMGLTLQNRSRANDETGPSSSIVATDDKDIQEKIQGKWKIVHCEFSGQDDAQIAGVEHTISGDKWLRPNRRTAEYRLKLDPSKDPRWVDLAADRLGDRTLRGIYSLQGDWLMICYAYDPELPRPTEFKTMPGVRGYLYVLKRVKNVDSSSTTDGKPVPENMQGKWKIVQCEFSGRSTPQPVGVEDTIKGDKWLRPNRRTAEYRLKLDPSKDPKWVDLSADRLGDRTLKGIYSLEGDKLTICYAYDPELPRPTEFKTMPGVRGYIYVLERVKD
jgi:uncharacterized protein (TIGR03067 family)